MRATCAQKPGPDGTRRVEIDILVVVTIFVIGEGGAMAQIKNCLTHWTIILLCILCETSAKSDQGHTFQKNRL
jgi:hypothetical protein